MKRFTTLIVDDERLARVSLRKKLSVFPEIEIVGEAYSVESAISAIENFNPDLLFLDIMLSDGSGFDLLEKVQFQGKVVFVTAFDEHALRAFEVNAIDYLLKPISSTRLKNLIARLSINEGAKEDQSNSNFLYSDRIMIEQKGFIHFMLIKDILKISSAKDYTIIYSVDGKRFIVNSSMNDWEKKLPEEHFFRANRTTIVNINRIEKTIRIGATADIYLKLFPDQIRISRGAYKLLKERFFYK